MMLNFIFFLTLHAGVAGEFGSIQAAIDSASDGDVIKVPPGIYQERIDFRGKSLQIIAWDFDSDRPGTPIDHVIIAPKGGPVVTMSVMQIPLNNQGRVEMVLEGFTVTGGTAERGGGIYISGNVFAEVYRCVILGNLAISAGGAKAGYGGGIFLEGNASLTLLSSLIVRNSAQEKGAALYASGAPGLEVRRGKLNIVNCTIAENLSPGPAVYLAGMRGETCIVNNIIWGNDGGDFQSETDVPAKCNIPVSYTHLTLPTKA